MQLFSYGTLQKREVQFASFGCVLRGRIDRLGGFRSEWLTISDADVVDRSGAGRHPIIVSGDSADVVVGTVFELSTPELAAADEDEVDDYRRRQVTLESGQQAWVYIGEGFASAAAPR